MKFIHRLADRALDRLAPETKAKAGSAPCREYACSTRCWRMCCPGESCTPCYCV